MMKNNNSLIVKLKEFFTFEKNSVRIILSLVIPILCETILSSLFGMVDYMMAGQYSTHALNAVGLFTTPSSLISVLFVSINTGTTTRVAWNIGAGRLNSARKVMRTSIILNIGLAIITTILSYVYAPQLIDFMASGQYGNVYEKGTVAYDGVQVFRICALGNVFSAVCSAITSSLRGAGENKIPLFYNMTANFLNVIGNYMFIYGIKPLGIPEMGAQGAALSTSLSRLLCMIFAICFLCFSKESKFSLKNKNIATDFSEEDDNKKYLFFMPDFSVTKKILYIGFPAMCESFVMQAGMMLFTKMVVSTGNDSYAAHQIANNINSLFLTVCTAFSAAVVTLVGQNLGAKNINGAKYYTRTIAKISVLISCVAAILINLFSRSFIRLYTSDTAVIEVASSLMSVCSIIVIVTTFQNCYSGALRGAGDTKFPLYSAIICTLFVRVVLTHIAVNILHFGIFFVWIATLCDLTLRAVIIHIRYRSGRWEKYSKKASE